MTGRGREIKSGGNGRGPVIYWMSRDQRAGDNWALLHAQAQALALGRPLVVAFCLAPGFLDATLRQYGFMLRGLAETAADLERKAIPFFLLRGDPTEEVPRLCRILDPAMLVVDFDPLRVKRAWLAAVSNSISAPIDQVDAHNIVPAWAASGKQEWMARTIRPKIERLLPDYLVDFPPLRKHPHRLTNPPAPPDWNGVWDGLKVDRRVPETRSRPGPAAARQAMKKFIAARLAGYDVNRNHPDRDAVSRLSAYLHFGQLSPQRLALEVSRSDAPDPDRRAFLEQLIIRRELSDNFCLYNPDYDRIEGFPEWSRKTLDRHRNDPRRPIYRQAELESAATHDRLWNAAQRQMVESGYMHGYLRMYWAKKVLEWSPTPEEALAAAIRLNDRYQLDGRDPNGYVGIAWSIGGVHDRPWFERPVFGSVRYLSGRSIERRLETDRYREIWGVPSRPGDYPGK